MRGIISVGGYVPYHRLNRSSVREFFGIGGGRGSRSVAGYDEDTTTMGVEAARLAIRSGAGGLPWDSLWFSTSDPAYLDKTNAVAIHAALRLSDSVAAFDFGGSLRSGVGALRAALDSSGTIGVVSADRRDGLPTSADEVEGGDGAAAIVVGSSQDSTNVIAEYLGGCSLTDEFVDRWRTPGSRRSRVWEERFGETRYLSLGRLGWERGLMAVALSAEQIDRVCVTGMHAKAVRTLTKEFGSAAEDSTLPMLGQVGQTGAAHTSLALTALLEDEAAGQVAGNLAAGRVLALIHLSDGADVLFFRTTDQLARRPASRPIRHQVASGADMDYGTFLSWRQQVFVEPPRRPEPNRVSSSAAWRNEAWKFGLVGSRDLSTGAIHLPPARISMAGGAVDEMDPAPMADRGGTIVTFTIDRMAYSPSPPVVFAVVDLDGGGRFPLELTDLDAATLTIGARVEMTFRKLSSADGIHNYFWKATPVRDGGEARS
jgi:hydroxymethylglutaryl-CoA synthase